MLKSHSLRQIILDLAALLLVLLALALPRAGELARFVTPDEQLWLTRSANFYEALSRRDYAATFQREHPGVTTMWAGAAGFWRLFPAYKDLAPGQVNLDKFNEFMLRNVAPVSRLEVLREARLVMVIAHVLILMTGYLYARRLLGTFPALLGFLLIAFDPFHLGLTRLLHLDGLMTNFILLSLLAFLVYLNEKRALHVLVSGAAAGLAWLTKSPALFLLPVIGILILVDLWKSYRAQGMSVKLIWRSVWPGLVWALAGAAVFVAFWPAMWVAPLQALSRVFESAKAYAEIGHGNDLFFNGQIIPDGKLGIDYFYFYPLTYLWRATPVVLFGLVLAGWGWLSRRRPFNQPATRLTCSALVLLAAVFLIGMTVGAKKFDRYLLPAYPALDLIAGVGWYALFSFFWDRKPSGVRRLIPALLLALAIGLQAASALSTYPYYLSYYNPFMGGSRVAPQVMQVGWGEGLDQAARYLNQKPDAANLKVISWYATGPFSYIFEGSDRSLWYTSDLDAEQWEKFITSDYAVIYISQWQRGVPKPVLDYVAQLTPEHVVVIDGLEYARVYKLR